MVRDARLARFTLERGSRLRRFPPSENVRKRLFCSLPTLRHYERVGAKLKAWRIKMFYNFQVLKSDMVFGINFKFLFLNI